MAKDAILKFLLGHEQGIKDLPLYWRTLNVNNIEIRFFVIVTIIRERAVIKVRSVGGTKPYLDGQTIPFSWLFIEKPVVDTITSAAKILRMNFVEELEVAKTFMTNSVLTRIFSELTRQHLLFSTNPDLLELFILRGVTGYAMFHRKQQQQHELVSLTLVKVVGEHPCRMILDLNKFKPVTVWAEKGRLSANARTDTYAQRNLIHYLNNNLTHTTSKRE